MEVMVTNTSPELQLHSIKKFAKDLVLLFALHMAEKISSLLRQILDHSTKVLYDPETEALFLPLFWFLPIYRELLNTASRHRPSRDSELLAIKSKRQFWPTLTTRHASLAPLCADALQRERRQMQSKHLWYTIDIRWHELAKKIQVLTPTGLTREQLWHHLFVLKHRQNPFKEGKYKGVDFAEVERRWKLTKEHLSL